ncbi:right-handed parallel beta-helix repeat-containing protein [Paenarthrobacter ureafaciens]|uniref:right-handed parallel beta-helix repeat-containing protein n=2 Tax=Paenarthrobacter ureafaciens TaxID=37931 RepID=UPI003464CDBA
MRAALNGKVNKGELFVNVKDYDAKGDGSSDDTTAIAYAKAAAGPGGVVWFPKGTYIASTISIGSDVTFQGEPGATIKQKPGTNYFLVNLAATGVKFEARSITFDQNNAEQTTGSGKFLFNAAMGGATSEFHGVTFKNFCEGAVRIVGDRVSTTREVLRVFNCKFRGGTESTSGTYDTFTIFAADAAELTVCDSDFDHGLTLTAQGIPAITVGATVTDSADYTEVTVRNNRFKGYGRFTVGSGIGVVDSYAWATRMEVTGNKFIASRTTPIRGKVNAQNAIISGNMMTDFVATGTDFGNGISLVSATLAPVGGNYEIASNIIVGAPETAINVSQSSGTVKNIDIHDNIIDSPVGLGITLVRMENFNVHDNVIKSAGAQGITLSNCAGKGRIANNTVAGSGLTGIQTIGDQPSLDIHVLNNFVEASTASGITVENVRSLSLQGNTVKDVVDGGASGQRGFRIGGSTSGISTGQVKNNTAIGTFASGAYSLIGIGIATAFEDGNSWNFQKGYGSAAPASGTWARGSTIWNTAPAASGAVGWICVTAGTPGTWKTFGNIAA